MEKTFPAVRESQRAPRDNRLRCCSRKNTDSRHTSLHDRVQLYLSSTNRHKLYSCPARTHALDGSRESLTISNAAPTIAITQLFHHRLMKVALRFTSGPIATAKLSKDTKRHARRTRESEGEYPMMTVASGKRAGEIIRRTIGGLLREYRKVEWRTSPIHRDESLSSRVHSSPAESRRTGARAHFGRLPDG